MVACNVTLNQQDIDDFNRALEVYAGIRVTDVGGNKTFAYALNRTAKDVAYRAAQFTHKADANALRTMLGQSAVSTRVSKKTGKTYAVRGKARPTNDAGAVLARRMTKAGKNLRKRFTHEEWQEIVRKFVGRTLRSVNFMRAGWLHSARELARRVHEPSGISSSEAFGRRSIDERGEFAVHAYDPKLGEVEPSHLEGDVIVVEIANKAVNPRNKTSWSLGLGLHCAKGLERALAFKANDMLKYVEDVADAVAKEQGLT